MEKMFSLFYRLASARALLMVVLYDLPLNLAAIFPSGHWRYCSEKSPCSQKSIFPIDHHCKRDVCKTVDRTPRTANNVNYDSFYYELLIHGGFIFVKLSSSREKRFKNPWRHHNVKSMGRAGARGRGQRGKHYCAYSVGRTTRKQTRKLETFFGVCARRAIPIGLNGRHF